MRNGLISALIVSLCAAVCIQRSSAEEVFTTGYLCSDADGRPRWSAETEIRHKEGEVYILTEKGKGRYSGYEGEVSWIADLEFESTERSVTPVFMEKKVFNNEGELLTIDKQEFDLRRGIVTCTSENAVKGRSRIKKFKLNKDAVNRLILGLYIQKFLEDGKTLGQVQMVSEEPACYNVEIAVEDTETIEVNGVRARAFRICLDPKLGLLDFVKVFLPKAYVWHSADPKFEWLMYKGLEGSVNSPQIEIITMEGER